MEARPGTDRGASYDPSTSSGPPEKASIVEDFIDIFHSPSSVFARRENSGFGIQLLIVSLLAAAFAFANRGVMSQMMDVEFQRAAAKTMAANPQITMEMMNQGRGIQQAIFSFMSYLGTPIMIFVVALVVWLASMVFSAKVNIAQAAMIVTLAWIPRALGQLVTTVQAVLMDTSTVNGFFGLTLSPARFMDPDTANPVLFAAAANLELFGVWTYLLIGIGLAVVAKVPRGRGYAAAAVAFVFFSLFTIVPALMQ